MLDQEILDELKTVFTPLTQPIVLRTDTCSHADQDQLLEMLNAVASASPLISVESSPQESLIPSFSIHVQGKPQSISFKGIPGGHEFTSLILAILNSSGQGKLPDPGINKRIQSLKGPIQVRTYISLTCENCPEIVQALNLMSTLHPQFKHEMIDGAYVQNEIERLKIQGVPSVFVGDQMLHSGKTQFLELLTILEKHFGTNSVGTGGDLGIFDVVIVGAGPAGASAAIYSARKGLKTAIVAERFGGQVQDTKGIENLISVIYTEGPQLGSQLLQHVRHYPVSIFEHRRVKTIENSQNKDLPKKLILESGESISARSLIIATGAKWRELNIPGEKDYLGRGVAFCPHCDGPYYKGKKVAVIGGGNSGVEAAIDLAGIVREIVLVEFNPTLKADQVLVAKLKSLSNVSVITNARTSQILGDGTKVHSFEVVDRTSNVTSKIELDGVFVQIGLLPNSQFLKGLVELTPFGEVVVNAKGKTSADGIYAAGDVTTTPYKQIIIAMGEGAKAALASYEEQLMAGSST